MKPATSFANVIGATIVDDQGLGFQAPRRTAAKINFAQDELATSAQTRTGKFFFLTHASLASAISLAQPTCRRASKFNTECSFPQKFCRRLSRAPGRFNVHRLHFRLLIFRGASRPRQQILRGRIHINGTDARSPRP